MSHFAVLKLRPMATFACATVLALATQFALAQGNRNQWEPTTLEVARLPQYCHGQFVPQLRELWMSQVARTSCGTYMNHFCPGLVLINRAADPSRPKHMRKEDLRMARGEIDYTKKFLQRPCALEGEIQAAESRLRVLEMTVK